MENKKAKTCCFAGHRDLPQDIFALRQKLRQTLVPLIMHQVHHFVAGGARGFDTLAALAVIALREVFPEIKLQLVLPCPQQIKGWPPADIAIYKDILQQADSVIYTAEKYGSGCMQARNRHMVDQSSLCIAYCTRNTGGTAYTVQYAKQKGIPIIVL